MRAEKQLLNTQHRQLEVDRPHEAIQHLAAKARVHVHARQLVDIKQYTLSASAHEMFARYFGKPQPSGRHGLQHHLTQRISLSQRILNRKYEATLPVRMRQLALASRAPQARRLLLVRPCVDHSTDIDDVAFRDFAAIRFGLSLDPLSDRDCPACGDRNALSLNPTHYLICNDSNLMKHINYRHNTLRDLTCQVLNSIGGSARIEDEFAIDGSKKRADGDWIIEGKRILWDNAVVDPLAPSHVKDHFGILKTASDSERRKRTDYEARAAAIHAEFVPLVVESTGGFGQCLVKFITRLREIAQRKVTMGDHHALIDKFQDEIACLIARNNSWIIQRGCLRSK